MHVIYHNLRFCAYLEKYSKSDPGADFSLKKQVSMSRQCHNHRTQTGVRSRDFYHLLITFANSLDPDQA